MPEAPEHILVIRLKSIGDVILTLPAVHALRENFPAAKITFLTSKENAVLLQGFQDVNETISVDRAALRTGNPVKMGREILGLFQRLRAGKFSLVVDYQGYGETAWLARITGAPNRWGSVYSIGRKWAYTRGIGRDDDIQISDFNLSLLRQCGLKIGAVRNEFVLPPEPLNAARDFFSRHQLDPLKPTLYIQAFTSVPHKNWLLEEYLALAAHFRASGHQIIFGGGPRDVAPLERARNEGFVVATGVPLMVAAGLVYLSAVTLGGVTGLLHLAVAMKKRVVMLVGDRAGQPGLPYQHYDWVVSPLEGLDPSKIKREAVIEACERAFSESAGNVFY
jgi:ADP-heptose:LPS heptosyltransferase